ncbi:tol-pal system protein YbgF [Legionella worsleiensis]|uniref:Cell division coordinator CpoB n=1 Tax=Legionella worsleiensis TaxID=45076 RepID=A0A0W1AJ46_9GAMM|nr:tol-pal system protein YbgF [Legionella worsleiensis]KTD81278.1 outer membrane protein [Legionella worsleiensis]STY30845.1 outer membrane protein [Legionella worsleiensis]
MIRCKKTIIAACFTVMLPLAVWSEAPVVDDSDNFALFDGQQTVKKSSVGHPKYDEPVIENADLDDPQNQRYSMDDMPSDDGPALVQDDQSSSTTNISNNAKLIDKILSLQQEVQELRGQLEVQAHDLKMLQQQQVAFYKDLDARIGNASGKMVQNKPATDLNLGSASTAEHTNGQGIALNKPTKTLTPTPPVAEVSRANPADEQISYLAAYELVQKKRYDDALVAMEKFAQKYPNGGYTANAEYWLGELYLVKRDYPKAIEHFETVLQKFPSSNKTAASLLKSGYAFVAKGDNQEARRRFQLVVKTYPGTSTAQLAQNKLEAIKTL